MQPIKPKELEPKSRIAGFEEVVFCYTEEEALKEARRCVQCKDPTCISGCPVGIDIKKFIKRIIKKDYKGAYLTIKEKNDFPSICGRVCPAEYQCRKACVFTKKGEPFASGKSINIHFLERFVGDWGLHSSLRGAEGDEAISKDEIASRPFPPHASYGGTPPYACNGGAGARKDMIGKKVAVVGSGPAGLCCAGELARGGVSVTIFESLHKTGGVLRYGIPPFRLPQGVLDFEINCLKKLGVQIVPNVIIGKGKTLDELFKEEYSAIFLGLGAGTPSFLKLAGENLCNVYSANEFLTRVNLMGAYKFPESHTPVNVGKAVVVIGGGNTAIDAARVALRLQKINNIEPNVSIFYRRTEIEMPARRLEIWHAKEEGIKFKLLTQPIGFSGDDKGHLRKIQCLSCQLGEPDSSGRRRPVPMEGSEFEADCDLAIVAVGLNANQLLTKETPSLKVDKWGDIEVNSETMETSVKNIYAGGDIVGGEGTVIEAMGMAKKAAKTILERLPRNSKS